MNKFRESLLMKAFSFCVRVYNLIHNQSVKIDIILFLLHNAIHMV